MSLLLAILPERIATAAATLVLLGASSATAPIAGSAAGTLTLTSVAQAEAPISGSATGVLPLMSAAQAESIITAQSTGLLVLTSQSEAVVTPIPSPANTGGGGWYAPPDYKHRLELPTRRARAYAVFVLAGRATAVNEIKANAAGTLRLTGAAHATTDWNEADEDLLFAIMELL